MYCHLHVYRFGWKGSYLNVKSIHICTVAIQRVYICIIHDIVLYVHMYMYNSSLLRVRIVHMGRDIKYCMSTA